MDINMMTDLGREAIYLVLHLGLPILLVTLAVGLFVGILQAMTQIQEQSLVFVPKVLVVLFILGLLLPSILTNMVEYMQTLITEIPGRF
ncbi:MAG: flagellar biosynthetic protein FliQ [Planctomycetia bacterium]|nr:flagellar biosynthetic protein FliQ [Planctomycetia bacterium]